VTSRRRAARAARAREEAPPVFDYRDPKYGIPKWPPGPDNPVSIHAIHSAKARARRDREAWELEHQDEP
jgi:hypothetical protein